ncbi:MAG: 4-(cytidine 5'-diphospho)-2-C-methyl-D-erythritol kinase [Anaerovoracaceae bacterium]|jgi:4-diphosphocytidyl-2-C-methyl-D-erythritol kinase
MKRELTIYAHAKINLSLDVLGMLDNGYHAVDMILQMIGLHDDVAVRWEAAASAACAQAAGRPLTIALDPGRDDLPADDGNLAVRAARLMVREHVRRRGGEPAGSLRIAVTKRIPVAAGLAGGSGNGAAVLLALNELWDLHLPLPELCALGAELGADVPFSVIGLAKLNRRLGLADDPLAAVCARATGTGTELEPLPGWAGELVLAHPPLTVSTAEVYRGLRMDADTVHPDVAAQAAGIRAGDPKRVAENAVNVLENYSLNRYDKIVYTKNMIKMLAPEAVVLMSGSGPSVFALVDDPAVQEQLLTALGKAGIDACRTESLRA